MAVSINKVVLIGNLGKDPEIRKNQDGSTFMVLSLATSEQWKDRLTEEKKERTEWHRVVVFNQPLVQIYKDRLKKGQKIYVEGALHSRKWLDQNNNEQRTYEVCLRYRGDIVMLDSRSHGGEESPSGHGSNEHLHIYAEEKSSGNSGAEPMESLLDDELPF